ncbi:MAG: hypothetical protein HQK62_09155 [Desulfamplus sp.]|nr:hypothetical protein [Desulfamplus sp.]
MGNLNPALSDSGSDAPFLTPNNRITAMTEQEILLEKEIIRRDIRIETLQRIHNSVSVELLETNKAIALLARKYEKISQDKEVEVAKQIEERILPCALFLKEADKDSEEFELELDMLISQIKSMVRELTYGSDSFNQLSPAEMRVALLIKQGATSPQIADRLFISESTVKTHRKNIRSKLNIQNKKLNMVEYLNKVI